MKTPRSWPAPRPNQRIASVSTAFSWAALALGPLHADPGSERLDRRVHGGVELVDVVEDRAEVGQRLEGERAAALPARRPDAPRRCSRGSPGPARRPRPATAPARPATRRPGGPGRCWDRGRSTRRPAARTPRSPGGAARSCRNRSRRRSPGDGGGRRGRGSRPAGRRPGGRCGWPAWRRAGVVGGEHARSGSRRRAVRARGRRLGGCADGCGRLRRRRGCDRGGSGRSRHVVRGRGRGARCACAG